MQAIAYTDAPMAILNIWLYRVGRYATDHNSLRAMWSETWLCTTPPPSVAILIPTLSDLAATRNNPFGSIASANYVRFRTFLEELYPKRQLFNVLTLTPLVAPALLNLAAPEAAFRLRRVGAPGTPGSPLGRICYPILSDSLFTDLPHRRHVDVATLRPLLTANLNTRYQHRSDITGRVYTNVIFHGDHTYTPVHHYELEVNPVRIWQRWRTYDYGRRAPSDSVWQPQEP